MKRKILINFAAKMTEEAKSLAIKIQLDRALYIANKHRKKYKKSSND